jgi:hypothetical protein
MERRAQNLMKRIWTILFCIAAILLFAAPSGWAGDYDDGTHEVESTEDYLNIGFKVTGTTVNLYANITTYISVASGSFLNIHYGNVGTYIIVASGPPSAIVTVYGTGFGGDGDFTVPGQVTFSGGSGTLTGTYGNQNLFNLSFSGSNTFIVYLEDPVTSEEQVEIDIKPGSYPNSINLGSNGVVPVAVLTGGGFDVATVDPSTVVFAGASPLRWALEDVDDDGDLDIVFHFKTQELDLDESSTEATLTGQTDSGDDISGTDDVRIVPAKSKNNKNNKKK